MHRLTVFALFAAALFAQDAGDVFNKPPAGVEQALRKRIDEFYQYHVKQEFRKAEALVAEDTKDFFYSHNKPAYLNCEVGKISYTENFTHAKAVVSCAQYVMVPGFADKPLKIPFGSTWKLVDGQWYWYVDPESLKETPFGKMKPGPPAPGGAPAGGSPFPALPDNADFVMQLVRAEKGSIDVRRGESAQVNIINGAPGVMDISLVDSIPGLEAKFDHLSLKVGDKAALTLKAGNDAQSGILTVKVEQTAQLIELHVNVKPGVETARASTPENARAQGPLVKAEKGSIDVKRGQSGKVNIVSAAPGMMSLALAGPIPGVEAKFDHANLKAGEPAVLTVKAGVKARSGVLKVKVEPTGQLIEIQVNVK